MTKERKLSEEKYPVGTRIKLIGMEDPQAIQPGTCGTVAMIDDKGQLHMNWDNGRTLAVVPEKDSFLVIGKASNEGGAV